MSVQTFSEYRAAGNQHNPQERLDQLLRSVQKHGYNVPNMEGYEQFGTRFATDFLRENTPLKLLFIKGRDTDANDFRLFALNDYKSKYANTRQYNKETKKYELFDTRTQTFFDRENALEYIESKNSEAAKVHYQKIYGTETPEKDIKYLQALVNLDKKGIFQQGDYKDIQNYKNVFNRANLQIIEGTEITVEQKKEQEEYTKKLQNLNKLKIGTSFEKKENAQLEYNINQAVKNQEDQPINMKDLSVITPYVETRRKQLEIDKHFNTSPSGVTY